ncbi:MAG: hypothetical protein WBY38_13155, partial [Candidatus Acidiferrales bacterium]
AEWQTGLWISLNAGTTHWTNRLVAPLRLIPLRLRFVIVSSQEALTLQCVYVIDDWQRFVGNQPFSLLARSFSEQPTLLTQRKLTCVNIEALAGAPQFRIWG